MSTNSSDYNLDMKKSKKMNFKTLCESCREHPCCTSCESPFLLDSDIKKIEKFGPAKNFFEEVKINGKSVNILKKKSNTNECLFWDKKKQQCSIYSQRPFDCKLFPFDIRLIDGEYHWVVFSCNPESDWSWSEDYLNEIENSPQFIELLDKLSEYSSFMVTTFGNEQPNFTILRKVRYTKIIHSNRSRQKKLSTLFGRNS